MALIPGCESCGRLLTRCLMAAPFSVHRASCCLERATPPNTRVLFAEPPPFVQPDELENEGCVQTDAVGYLCPGSQSAPLLPPGGPPSPQIPVPTVLPPSGCPACPRVLTLTAHGNGIPTHYPLCLGYAQKCSPITGPGNQLQTRGSGVRHEAALGRTPARLIRPWWQRAPGPGLACQAPGTHGH